MRVSEFDHELYKCKAISLADDETVLHGYYSYHSSGSHNDHSILVDEFDEEIGRVYANMYEINPYTLCRNTGIKTKDGYLYEYDLIQYSNGLSGESLGYIAFDDYKKSYVIRTSLNYSTHVEISKYNVTAIGNIVLNDEDCKKMKEYSDQREANYSSDPGVECRSTQRINKLTKQFLPK